MVCSHRAAKGQRQIVLELPWMTLTVAATALVASLVTGAAERLEYNRLLVAAGQIWRLLTGQLVHWNRRMTLVDLGALLVLGLWLERRTRGLAWLTITASALMTALVIHLFEPDFMRYRGASGVASGLFVAVALQTVREFDSRMDRLMAVAALGLFLAKVLWESSTGRALAAGAFPEGIEVVPVVHLAGGAAGACAFLAVRYFQSFRHLGRLGLRRNGSSRKPSVNSPSDLPAALTVIAVQNPSLHEYRDVTPMAWGTRFHDQDLEPPCRTARFIPGWNSSRPSVKGTFSRFRRRYSFSEKRSSSRGPFRIARNANSS